MKMKTIIGMLLIIGSVLIASVPAHADTEAAPCTVGAIGYNTTSPPGKNFWINCTNDGTWEFAYLTVTRGTGCTTDVDSLKLWHSIATAAKLAGKTLDIWYNTKTCSGTSVRVIASVQMNP
jgi:hypothetical protein